MNSDFKAFAEDIDNIEVMRVCVDQDGNFYVPNERDGRIARVSSQRARLREFLLTLCVRLECPNSEHAGEPKPMPRRAAAR